MSHEDDCKLECIVVSGYIHGIEPSLAFRIIPNEVIELCHQFYTLCVGCNISDPMIDDEIGLLMLQIHSCCEKYISSIEMNLFRGDGEYVSIEA